MFDNKRVQTTPRNQALLITIDSFILYTPFATKIAKSYGAVRG